MCFPMQTSFSLRANIKLFLADLGDDIQDEFNAAGIDVDDDDDDDDDAVVNIGGVVVVNTGVDS